MFHPTIAGTLGSALYCFASLLLLGAGLWVWRRVQLPCLPWVLACWVFNFPLVVQLNSWCLDYVIGPPSSKNAVSLSGVGLFAKRDAMRQFMGWHSFFLSAGYFAVVLLLVADVTLLVRQLQPNGNDKMPRMFGLVRTFSPVFGFSALVLAIVNHLLSFLVVRIEP